MYRLGILSQILVQIIEHGYKFEYGKFSLKLGQVVVYSLYGKQDATALFPETTIPE